jgi:hypothetical protein
MGSINIIIKKKELQSKMRINRGSHLIEREAFSNKEISPHCGVHKFCVYSTTQETSQIPKNIEKF